MAFFSSRDRSAPRLPSRKSPVIAVGQRVFVNCPSDPSGSVALENQNGKVLPGMHLTDGVEVEVVAWRPRVAGDAHYRVRAPASGTDGWLPAGNLRRLLSPLPASEAHPLQATSAERTREQHSRPAEARGRRFGERS